MYPGYVMDNQRRRGTGGKRDKRVKLETRKRREQGEKRGGRRRREERTRK
jgi:hypothetical protein